MSRIIQPAKTATPPEPERDAAPRPAYEPPRIERKRSVARTTLQGFSGGGNPGQGSGFTGGG